MSYRTLRYGKSIISKLKKELDRAWSLAVRTRDNFTCQKCGRKGKYVHAAHIFARTNLATRWLLLNGVTLCYGCHIWWAHNAPVEFTLWVRKRIGESAFMKLQKKSKEIYSAINLKTDFEKILKKLK